MEVNAEALEGLKILGDSTFIPDAAFGSLTEDCFNYATGVISDEDFKGESFDLYLNFFCSFVFNIAVSSISFSV